MTLSKALIAKFDSTSVVAVIGAGAMGAGIAQITAQSGHRVLLFDQNEAAIFKAKESVALQLHKRVLKGKLSQENYDLCLENIIPTYSMDELASADLVIEAIIESLEVKQSLFLELESICKETCIFTSNTSSISITSIASKLSRPERFLGLHFFNPAPVMPLVEVISGLASDQALAKVLYQACMRWGKSPVYAKSSPGFIVNRVARPFYAEALRILDEQGASISQIDELMRECGRFKMGPFELMDLIGHDVNYAVTESVFHAYYQDPKFKPSLSQKSLLEAGFLGRKTGRGFYQYNSNGDKYLQNNLTDLPIDRNWTESKAPDGLIKQIQVTSKQENQPSQMSPTKDLIERFLSNNFYFDNETNQDLEQQIITIFKFGEAHIALTNGLTATERAKEEKLNNLVLFDLAFDYSSITKLAISASDNCSSQALDDAFTLFDLIGITLIKLDDTPGLVLMRTLAMLTNEAVETRLQGVATGEDIDKAMCAGVNYPQGPIAWGQRVGLTLIHQVLTNLQLSYGEDRYRPSSLLRRLSVSGKKIVNELAQ
ncbi:MAG: 3-hydroxyacyl-CoA dehydrogenase [Marinomonas sp.]